MCVNLGREFFSVIVTVFELLQTEWHCNIVPPSSHEPFHTASRHNCVQVHQDTHSLRGKKFKYNNTDITIGKISFGKRFLAIYLKAQYLGTLSVVFGALPNTF